MQKAKPFRPRGWPWRARRAAASSAFARAMAKAEFGRHYVDDKQLEEVQRSLERAKARQSSAAEKGAQHLRAANKGKTDTK